MREIFKDSLIGHSRSQRSVKYTMHVAIYLLFVSRRFHPSISVYCQRN